MALNTMNINDITSETSPLSLRNIVIVDDVLTVELWVNPDGQSLESFDFYDVTFDAGIATLDNVDELLYQVWYLNL